MLEIIGSGLGRTGTYSTKLALEQLGYPCHHMAEVFTHPQSIPLWVAAWAGHPDWETIFEGYRAQIDHPGAQFYAELAAYYPNAKVLHTVRDPEAWFVSTQATIFAPDSPAADPARAAFFNPIFEFFGGEKRHDRAHMIDFFHRHTEQVKATIPAERLLVWDVAQGWEPLCAFLGVEVPDGPLPHQNTTAQFRARQQAPTGAH